MNAPTSGGDLVRRPERACLPLRVTDPNMDANPIVHANRAFLRPAHYDADETFGGNGRVRQGDRSHLRARRGRAGGRLRRSGRHGRNRKSPQGRRMPRRCPSDRSDPGRGAASGAAFRHADRHHRHRGGRAHGADARDAGADPLAAQRLRRDCRHGAADRAGARRRCALCRGRRQADAGAGRCSPVRLRSPDQGIVADTVQTALPVHVPPGVRQRRVAGIPVGRIASPAPALHGLTTDKIESGTFGPHPGRVAVRREGGSRIAHSSLRGAGLRGRRRRLRVRMAARRAGSDADAAGRRDGRRA